MKQYRIDAYVLDTLMLDLVRHDHQPSAFLVYLHLYCLSNALRGPVGASHQSIADATGLSKSAVQTAVRRLMQRRLLRARRETITSIPQYTVLRPWKRSG